MTQAALKAEYPAAFTIEMHQQAKQTMLKRVLKHSKLAAFKAEAFKAKQLAKMCCVLLLCAQPMLTRAAIVAWQPNIPSSLSAFQNNPQALAQLAQNNILIFSLPAGRTQLPTLKTNPQPQAQFTVAAVVVPASTEHVANVLQNYAGYVGLFPTLKKARKVSQLGNTTEMEYQIHIPTPIPVLNFKETVRMQHQRSGNRISTIILDAPIPYGLGSLEWFSLGPKQTLVTLSQWGDLNQPKGFLFSTILKALPDAKLGIPSGTNAFILEAIQQRFTPPKAQFFANGHSPSLQLNALQLQKLTALSRQSALPVTYVHPLANVQMPSGREDMRFSSSMQYFDKSPQQLQPWLNPQVFQTLFPNQIKKVDVQKIDTSTQQANYKIAVGLGVIAIPFQFQLRFKQNHELQQSFVASGGDLRLVRGQMQITPTAQGSLLQISSAVKVDQNAPFLLRAARSLPYYDMLPAVGANATLTQKIKQKLSLSKL